MVDKYLNRLIFFLLSLLVISLPFSKALSSIAVVSLLVLSFLVIFLQPKARSLSHSFFTLLPCGLFFAYLISLIYSEDFSRGVKFVYIQNSYLIIPIIIWINRELIRIHSVRFFRMYVRAVTIASLFTLCFFILPENRVREIIDFFPLLNSLPETINRVQFGLYSPFIDRLQFSNLITISILTSIWLIASGKANIESLITISILMITSLLLGGRGGQLALFAGIGVWLIRIYRANWQSYLSDKMGIWATRGIFFTSLILIFIIVPYVIYETVPAVTKRYQQMVWELKIYQDGSFTMHDYDHFTSLRRLVAYQNSLIMIKEHPLLGVGIGDFQDQMQQIYDRDQLEFTVNSHNQLLFLWNTTGIIGVVALLIIVAYAYWKFALNPSFWFGTFSLSFITAYVVIMMFDTINTQIDGINVSWMYSLLALTTQTQK